MSARPYTCEEVADLWGCSDNHVRNLIKRGELKAFRIGRRLIRIPADAVEDYVQCQLNGPSVDSTDALSSPGGMMGSGDVIVLRHAQPRKPRLKP